MMYDVGYPSWLASRGSVSYRMYERMRREAIFKTFFQLPTHNVNTCTAYKVCICPKAIQSGHHTHLIVSTLTVSVTNTKYRNVPYVFVRATRLYLHDAQSKCQ